MKKFKDESYETMYDLFITQNLSCEEIANIYNTTKGNIAKILSRNKIKKPRNLVSQISKKTNLERYGVENPMQLKEVQDKVKKTNISKYGVENVYQSKEIQTKIRKTNLERYGVEHQSQRIEIKNKIRATNLERYGVEHALQSQEIRDKGRQTLLNKTGIDVYTKHTEINKHIKNGTIREYFINNYNNLTLYEISKLTSIPYSRIAAIVRENNLQDLINRCHDSQRSIAENEIFQFIKSLNITNIQLNNKDILKPLEIDIYLPDYNIAIEFNGTYWHSNLNKPDNYHINKSKAAEDLGIRLIHIYEYEWNDLNKQEKIKSMLKIALGKTDTKIYARQCEIRKILNDEAKPFNNLNHLQGHRAAKITYGLFYKNELVQLMSFGHNYKLPKDVWEIVRGCPASNNVVVGGVSKLFKHFIKEHNPDKIFSYCDFNKFDGHGYESLGMKFIGYTGPDLTWVLDHKLGIVASRSPKRHSEYKEKSNNTYIKGAGSKKYLWTRGDTDEKI